MANLKKKLIKHYISIIFLIENNGYGLSTPSSEQFKCKNLSDKAIGYGIKGFTIDGNNVF